jgi:phosphatidylserine/phosphatidylglycerophosphate/cardiolipin synthase-like enzyme
MKIAFSIFLSLFVSGLFAQSLMKTDVEVSSFTTSGFTIHWENHDADESYIRYGFTPNLEMGEVALGVTSAPQWSLQNASPAQLVYVQAKVQNDFLTEETDTLVFITASLSSGDIKVYFNQSVNHEYALPGNEAIHLPQLIDDTLVQYINRATESIDMAIYNTTSSSSLANYIEALNQAFLNGIRVRVIYNENTNNSGIGNLHPDIPKLKSPPYSFPNGHGLMHNKFLVFDAQASNPSLPLVWTGSTNLTTQNVNTDPNHVIIIQDQSLAITYTLEFEEMWGGSGDSPDEQNSRFSFNKKDDTPHVFNIGGRRVECYFSPSDGVNSRIIRAINESNEDFIANTMLITRSDVAATINVNHDLGKRLGVLVNTEIQTTTFEQLHAVIGGRLADYTTNTGMLHHKTLLTDAVSGVNPMVLTGSHNWSTSAEDRNDENTLLIYDELIVNQFYQEFMARYEPIVQPTAHDDYHSVTSSQIQIIDVTANDELFKTATPYSVISVAPKHGTAGGSAMGAVSYLPDSGYSGKDSLQYTLCNTALFDYCDSAWVYFDVVTGMNDTENEFSVFPNPSQEEVVIDLGIHLEADLQVIDISGKLMMQTKLTTKSTTIDLSEYSSGVYFLRFKTSSGLVKYQKLVKG